MTISGVILAAGRSTRLGRPKQLLLLDGEPIIRITTRQALASQLDDVILVVGAAGDEVSTAVGDLGHRTVFNPDYAQGQSTSLRRGLAELPAEAEAVIFLLGDQPEVGADVIDALIDAFHLHAPKIAQATYGGIPANPVLFARPMFPELASVTGDEGARAIIKAHSPEILHVQVSSGPPPGDVDTDDDFRALQERWSAITS